MKKEVTRKTCFNCGHEFTYREKLPSTYRFLWRMNCKNCDARYSVLVRYRLLYGLLLSLPIILGPSLIMSFAWELQSVLIAEGIYFTALVGLGLFAVPYLPLKLDPDYKKSTKINGKEITSSDR